MIIDSCKETSQLYVIEVRKNFVGSADTPADGYGRDPEEAACHAGYGAVPSPDEIYQEGIITNEPDDQYSRDACKAICSFHADLDDTLPDKIRLQLKEFMNSQLYASAVAYCFRYCWDRGFEDEE